MTPWLFDIASQLALTRTSMGMKRGALIFAFALCRFPYSLQIEALLQAGQAGSTLWSMESTGYQGSEGNRGTIILGSKSSTRKMILEELGFKPEIRWCGGRQPKKSYRIMISVEVDTVWSYPSIEGRRDSSVTLYVLEQYTMSSVISYRNCSGYRVVSISELFCGLAGAQT